MHIIPFYAALLGLLFMVLSVRTLRARRRLKIAVGDAGNPEMLRAMRVHANFAEYVPFALLLLWFVEQRGAGGTLLHAAGSLLVAGRVLHAYGVSRAPEDFRFRVAGVAITLTTIGVSSISLLVGYARGGFA